MTTKAKRLRDLINAPEILVLPGVYDGFSARLVERGGFPAAFVTGSGVSEASLGWADLGIMGFEENLASAARLVGCCDLPLLADADTGYGNAVNVHFTVRGFEQAGLAGIMIEDQVWPKRCGHMKGKEVIPVEETVEKIRAAAEARKDPDFVIKSRTDTLATHGIAEVIRRLNLYAEAGADLLFADALLSVSDIETVVKNVSKPICVNMGFGIRQRSTTPLLSARQLQDLGVARGDLSAPADLGGDQGMKNALSALDGSARAASRWTGPDLLVSFEELNDLLGMPELQRLEQRYLTPEQRRAKYKGAAE